MIILDMDMPTKCMNCQLLGRDMMYCQVYPRKDLNLIKVANGKPDFCPIKCDIEDIKTEIAEYKDDKERNEMIDIVLEIIDRHCGKEHE